MPRGGPPTIRRVGGLPRGICGKMTLVSVSAAPPRATAPPAGAQQRPLAVQGAIAASAAAAAGLATLTTVAAIGWITAPHVGLGAGLPGVLRTAGVLWLVAHHVGVTVEGFGRIGLLPLGLVLLPGLLLIKAGRWLAQAAKVTTLRRAAKATAAIAGPYATLTGAVALGSGSEKVTPELWQAVLAGFLIAAAAGGLGIARGLVRNQGTRLTKLIPARPRSVLLGIVATAAVLTACGALLAGGSMIAHLDEYKKATDALDPGPGGAFLLLLAGLCYAPNAIIWSIAYMLGPGFAFGAGTMVAPTGSALGVLPSFPMLAALPSGLHQGAPVPLALAVLAAPYAAGVLGGLVTIRVAPTYSLEAGPMWGFATGALTGIIVGAAAAFSGGPLGSGRLQVTGPSGLQTAIVAVLEIGVSASVTAGAANWLVLRERKPLEPQHYESAEPEGHVIYMDPWAEDDELPAHTGDEVVDRVTELGLARLPRGHRVRPVKAVPVRRQLRPEHAERDQHQPAEPHPEHAQHDAADRAPRPPGTATSSPAQRGHAKPQRDTAEQERHGQHINGAGKITDQRYPEQAEYAKHERGPRALLVLRSRVSRTSHDVL